MTRYTDYKDSYKKAAKKYRESKGLQISAYIPKETKDDFKQLADSKGLSVNGAIKTLVSYALKHPEILDDTEE